MYKDFLDPSFNPRTDKAVSAAGLNELSEGGGAKIEHGSYVGTGTGGATSPSTLTFGFEPKMVFITARGHRDYLFLNKGMIASSAVPTVGANPENLSGLTFVENSVSWWATAMVSAQMNTSGTTYDYTVIG